MTLHRRKVDDSTVVHNGLDPLHVPSGWQIADGNTDDIRVCATHHWQSWYLVFANGDSYGTAGLKPGSALGSPGACWQPTR